MLRSLWAWGTGLVTLAVVLGRSAAGLLRGRGIPGVVSCFPRGLPEAWSYCAGRKRSSLSHRASCHQGKSKHGKRLLGIWACWLLLFADVWAVAVQRSPSAVRKAAPAAQQSPSAAEGLGRASVGVASGLWRSGQDPRLRLHSPLERRSNLPSADGSSSLNPFPSGGGSSWVSR